MPASGDDATATFRGVVTVSHHTFYLVDDGRFPSPPLPETTTGLVDAATDAAVIRTGIHTGVIDVTCQALSGPPPLDLAGWDAAAEIGIRASIGQVTVASLGFDLPEQFPVLTPAGPGEYRARVHARGRDTDIDGTASTPIELYLIQVWPAPLDSPIVHLLTDRYGTELLSAQEHQATQPPPAEHHGRDERADLLRANLLRAQNRGRTSRPGY